MMEKTVGKKLKNDLILISVLLLVIAVAACCYFFLRGEGDTVVITVGGEVYGEYSLHEDRTVEIRTEKTENIVVIRDGKVYMENASCPDGICAAHKAIFHDGESIICLPNQVVVRVSAKNQDTPDMMA